MEKLCHPDERNRVRARKAPHDRATAIPARGPVNRIPKMSPRILTSTKVAMAGRETRPGPARISARTEREPSLLLRRSARCNALAEFVR